MSSTFKAGGPSSLGHMPEGPWSFDEGVTAVFDDMLRRSIPDYDTMRQAVFSIGCRFAKPSTYIVDLGCSRGEALAPFISHLGDRNRYLGVEVAKPMLDAARQRFQAEIDSGLVTISDTDLRTDYPNVEAGLTLCILSLQFVPIEHRQRILQDAFCNTCKDGAFILVEKILGSCADLNKAMVESYYARKQAAGYTAEEIQRKRLSLEGVLVPVTASWNEELLRAAGFRQLDCFWWWMNFAGWIARK